MKSRVKTQRAAIIVFSLIIFIALSHVTSFIALKCLTYKADGDAIDAFISHIDANIEFMDGYVVAEPSSPKAGFIFYPGGLVDENSYLPLIAALAKEGILAVLVPMPLDLAVLNINGADGITELYPDVETWYIGGHSLGGAMASSYIGKNAHSFSGLVLLGAYSTANLSQTDIEVLSIYGSEDRVMNREKYEECKQNLPNSFTEYVIEGGNHAYYGMYGEQNGDGAATITVKEQISLTASQILLFIME